MLLIDINQKVTQLVKETNQDQSCHNSTIFTNFRKYHFAGEKEELDNSTLNLWKEALGCIEAVEQSIHLSEGQKR